MRFNVCLLSICFLGLLISLTGCQNRLAADLEEYMTVQDPSFSPEPGTYDDDMTIEMSCTTSGADIYYTLDGSEPTQNSSLYEGPFTLRGDGSKILIFARAFRSDMDSSSEVNGQFIIEYPGPEPPLLNLSPGIYATDIQAADNLTIAYNPANMDSSCRWRQQGLDVEIHYTTDGSQPDETSPVYSPGTTLPFTVTGDGTQFILNAVSYAEGYKLSNAVTGIYLISYGSQVETPVVSGTAPDTLLSAETTLYLSCATAGAEIRYTTDGSSPTEISVPYDSGTGIVMFPASGSPGDGDSCTVRARAFHSGMAASGEFEETYIYKAGTVDMPVFSPASGTYSGGELLVTVSTAASDVNIYYSKDLTCDLEDPDGDREIYSPYVPGGSGGIHLLPGIHSCIAVAEKNGIYSSIASAVYSVNE